MSHVTSRDDAVSATTYIRARRIGETMLGVLVALLLFAMMIVTVVDVVGRYFLSQPLPGAYELTEIMLAMAVFTGLPLVCLREEHISVALLTDRLTPGLQNLHASLASLIGSMIFGVVSWELIAHANRLASYGDTTVFLRIPKGPLGYAMAACAALAAIALGLVAIERFMRFRSPSSSAPSGPQ
jgi:TRAP-type transport system small permease protein